MMTNDSSALGRLSDSDLLANVHRAVQDERCATAHLIALLMELDARRLYLGEGFSSLFTYCTQALHLSEHEAYNRIEVARVARRFPSILGLVEGGAVTLTTVRLLAPHLTEVNHCELLTQAEHKSKREVELLLARSEDGIPPYSGGGETNRVATGRCAVRLQRRVRQLVPERAARICVKNDPHATCRCFKDLLAR